MSGSLMTFGFVHVMIADFQVNFVEIPEIHVIIPLIIH